MEEVMRTFRRQPPAPGSVVIWNAGLVDEVTAAAWMPIDHPELAALRATPEAYRQVRLHVVNVPAEIARRSGKVLEIRSVTYLQVGPAVYAIIRAA